MAIEPVSSAMTFQAQAAVKTQPVQTTATANMEVPVDGQTVNVDTTTAAIAKTQAEEKSNNSENGKDNGNKESGNNAKQQAAIPQTVTDPLRKAIAEMNRKINNSNEEAVFGIHEETNRITIKILDKDTKEVIKEFPPEKTLDMIAKLWEVAGILVDEKR